MTIVDQIVLDSIISNKLRNRLRSLSSGEYFDLYTDTELMPARENYGCGYLNLRKPHNIFVENILRKNRPEPDAIYKLSNVKLSGLGFRYYKDQPITESLGWPDYLSCVLDGSDYRSEYKSNLQKPKQRHEKKVFHITHPHMRLFGHFLTEGLYKLLLLNSYLNKFSIPLYLSADSPSFLKEYVRLTCPNIELIIAEEDEILLVDELYDFYFHPNYIWPKPLVKLFQDFSKDLSKKPTNGNVYISRKSNVTKTWHRSLANSDELEEMAIQKDYYIATPETLRLEDQINVFSNAKIIVGEYSSALHNAVFSKPGTHIICLNQVNEAQQALALNFDHNLIFIIPDEGYPVDQTTSQSVANEFNIDKSLLEEAIGIAEAINNNFPADN